MTEVQLFEKIGRMHVALEERDVAYRSLLGVLGGVVGGGIEPSRVLVNLTAQAWNVSPIGERPGLPATINGLPVCVIAPDPAKAPSETPAEANGTP